MSATEAEIVGRALKGRRNGSGYLCRCPNHDDRTPSLSVASGTYGRLLLKCFAGCAGADVLAELRALGILDSREPGNRHGGKASLDGMRKTPSNPKPTLAEADLQRRIDRAVAIYHESGDIRGTLVESYLTAHRGITVTADTAADPYLFDRVRFHSACFFRRDRAPALVAAVTGPSGYLSGVWRIRLDDLGNKVERMGLGDCRGAAVRLVPALDDDHLAVTEGIEDALAFMQITSIATWAGCSTSGVAGMVLPPRFRRVIIVADADTAGAKAAGKLASRLKAEGRVVRTIRPPEGFKDANEAIQAGEAA